MEVLLVVLRQGGTIPCRCCGQPITERDILTGNVEKEHIHEVALGGPDIPDNCAFSHKAKPCHATVTHGNGATFAGSSRHKIKKATDPERIEKFKVNKTPLTADAVGEPPQKCRRCGEMTEDCICPPPPPRRSAFDRARR
jgi:hypothetical protein